MNVCELSREGEFKVTGDPRVLYTIMMMIRTKIVYQGNQALGIAALIATRYSAIRRQFKTIDGSKMERTLLDYQTQQHKLAPMIATIYVQQTVGHYCNEGFGLLQDAVKKGDFGRLDVMHHLLAGYKSIFSDRVLNLVEVARRSAGGAGYSAWSGLPNIYFNSSPVPTYEGDNTVMMLQSSRYLKKMVDRASKGKTIPEPFGYLNKIPALVKLVARINTIDDLLNLELLEEAMQVRAALYIVDVFNKMKESNAPEKTKENEIIAQQKLPMMFAHFDSVTVNVFRQRIEEDIKKGAIRSANNKAVYDCLVKIYILENLSKDNGILMSSGYISGQAFTLII